MTASAASRHGGAAVLACGTLLAVLCVASLFVGVSDLTPGRLFSDPEALRLVLVSRLPRTLAAILAGGGLAIAGLVMQTLARNRGAYGQDFDGVVTHRDPGRSFRLSATMKF